MMFGMGMVTHLILNIVLKKICLDRAPLENLEDNKVY